MFKSRALLFLAAMATGPIGLASAQVATGEVEAEQDSLAFEALPASTDITETSKAPIAIQKAEKVVLALNENGDVATTYVSAELVAPGETVRYSVEFENTLDRQMSDVVLQINIPETMIYVNNSALKENALITFSTDNGQSFRSFVDLTSGDDSESTNITAEDITDVQWVILEEILPGNTETVSLEAVLK